jgi:ABC-type polysaccharide/polyol phosphate transport system ATPase subunit
MEANGSQSHSGPILGTRGLQKHYGEGAGVVRALDGVDLDVAWGETVAVMGPSGCAKSTLLHLLGWLERPSAGEVWLEGRRPPWWLLAVLVGTPLVIAGLAAIPARLGSRRPVAEILQAELA